MASLTPALAPPNAAAPDPALDALAVNTIRILSAEAVQQANSGHPGLPMGAAAMAYVLWDRHLRHHPADPLWFNRDRFVLSAGHGSMLLYSLLHLTGYEEMTLDEIKRFRQWGSKTPGHPESFVTKGVEVTTGPLGQGVGMGVGLAMAEKHLAAVYNTDDHRLVDHYTYGIVSDGDLMEGVSHEAASLAGHLKLGKLIYLYDSNHISIDGPTDIAFTDDTAMRFEAYGWHVEHVKDGNDLDEVDAAIRRAKLELDRPSLLVVRTTIGYGAPHKQGTKEAHGEPLGPEEIAAAKAALGWPYEKPFTVPKEVKRHMSAAVTRGKALQKEWDAVHKAWAKANPEMAALLQTALARELPAGWDKALPSFGPADAQATREASGKALGALVEKIPFLVGGSADLTPSNKTAVKGRADFQAATPEGGYFRFGVREHGMAAAMNGMALHGGLRPYGGTFLIFSDYLRPALRLGALMGQPAIYVFTHDSIGLGEDGPTHQPIAQLMALRAIPNVTVLRPADANETAAAWALALETNDRPSALALSRQKLPVLTTARQARQGVKRGGYVLVEETGALDLILMGTGSEVHIAVEAAKTLAKGGVGVRVVSMPAFDRFDAQPKSYRDKVLPPDVRARVSIEAGATLGWERYVGLDGVCIGMEEFGASAPYEVLYREYGFTPERVVRDAKRVLRDVRSR